MRYLIFAFTISLACSVSATIINIPDDYATIQAGIDASTDGDTVLVQPGTYYENVNIFWSDIVLGSLYLTTGDTSYISSTIIDGNYESYVLNTAVVECLIQGFTFQRGQFTNEGGVILGGTIEFSHNIVRWNSEFIEGYLWSGICCFGGTIVIENNLSKQFKEVNR